MATLTGRDTSETRTGRLLLVAAGVVDIVVCSLARDVWRRGPVCVSRRRARKQGLCEGGGKRADARFGPSFPRPLMLWQDSPDARRRRAWLS